MPASGIGGVAARRAEAKRLASESADLAHVSMKVANSALEELRELREASSVSVDVSSVMDKRKTTTKKKSSGAGLEVRPTSSSAARAAETTADLDVQKSAKKKFERAKRRIMGHSARSSTTVFAKPAIRYPRPPSAPSTSLGTSGPHVRCDACFDGKIMRDAEVAWAKERATLQREIAAATKRNNQLEHRLKIAENARASDADELERTKKALFAANAAAKKVEARFNAQESGHRAEMQKKEEAAAAADERAEMAEMQRDDANASLKLAMQRMETVEARANANFAAAKEVEDSVRRMESEHAAALDEAAEYRVRLDDLEKEKEHARWSADILTKMSEMQLNQYRNKRKLLLTALDAGGHGLHEAIHGGSSEAAAAATTPMPTNYSITSG